MRRISARRSHRPGGLAVWASAPAAILPGGALLAVGALACGGEAGDGAKGRRSLAVDSLPAVWSAGPSLPEPVANNAVAALRIDGGLRVFSFLGIGSGKRFDAITRAAYELDVARGEWRALPPVPGKEGRIAATAEAVGGRVYVFGGYTVDADGGEASVEEVDVWDPETESWGAAAPFPVPVDDAISGVWRDSLIYLVSGWSQRDNVSDVQVYDPATDRWERATPIPGPPVFGHAGSIVGDAIVYCDGTRVDPARTPRFVVSESCWRGDIDPADPIRIAWRQLAPHPGPPKYRSAAGPVPDAGLIVFAGGTPNPYNVDGVGYDGVPSEPDATTFAYDVARDRWIPVPEMPVPTMDHRGLVGAGGGTLWVVGGMTAVREVTARTAKLELENRDGSEERE